MSELLVYKASAGSGKTFTLAVEYIKLLILNPRAYRQILAVTFTNKATAEMKERILSQLYGIQIGDRDSHAYLDRIKKETGSWKWTAVSFLVPTVFGIITCFIVASAARLFGVA